MMRRFVLAVVVLALVYTAVTALTQVQPGERAVVRRFGRILDERPGPGLYRGAPWGIDRVDRVSVGRVRRVSIGFTGKEEDDPAVSPAGQLLTGDHNVVNVQAEVYYKVREEQAEKFLLQEDRVEPLLARTAEAVLAEWIAGRTVDDVLVRGKQELPGYLLEYVKRRLEPYDLGIEIDQASIIRLYPPDEVKEAFDRLAQAQTSIRTQVNRAEQDANQKLSSAQADVYHRQRLAEAYGREQKLQSQAEADSFRQRLGQYRALVEKNPQYLNSLWLDEMTRLYARMKAEGRIEMLDDFLGKEGLTITQFPLMPKKK
jgi:modulator of FtsH protease HflK